MTGTLLLHATYAARNVLPLVMGLTASNVFGCGAGGKSEANGGNPTATSAPTINNTIVTGPVRENGHPPADTASDTTSEEWDVQWLEDTNIEVSDAGTCKILSVPLPKEPPIKLVRGPGNAVNGNGFSLDVGKYELVGIGNDFAIALHYWLPGKSGLVGVVLLQKIADGPTGGERMEGTWAQYSAIGKKIRRGSTIWTEHGRAR